MLAVETPDPKPYTKEHGSGGGHEQQCELPRAVVGASEDQLAGYP